MTYRRTVSVGVLVTSLVLVVVAAPSMYALRKWQLARTATAYLDRAGELEAQEEWLAAADYISRFLTLRPGDVEAEIRLAKTFAKSADSPARAKRAIAFYYTALGDVTDERQWPLRQEVADLLLKTARYVEAEAESRKIVEHDRSSKEAHKSLALARFGRADSGSLKGQSSPEIEKLALLATMDAARKLQPGDVQVALVQAEFLRRHPDLVKIEQPDWGQDDRHKNADLCLDELVAADASNPVVYVARFDYRQRYSLPGAEADLANALELGPHDAAVLAMAGDHELTAAQKLKTSGGAHEEMLAHAAKAAGHLRMLISEQPKLASADHHLALGQAQLLQGLPDEAIGTWNGGVKKFAGRELDFERQLADAYLELDRLDDAQRSLAQLDERINADKRRLSDKQLAALTAEHEFRRATLAFKRNDLANAIPQLQRAGVRLRASPADDQRALRALLMLGRCFESLEQWREAALAYDEACQREPRMPQVRLAAAQAWLAAGRADLAVERAEQSLALRDSTEAWLTLATGIYGQQLGLGPSWRDWGRFELALSETQKRSEANPLPQPWQIDLLRIDALIARRNEAEAVAERQTPQQILRDLEAKYPDDTQLWARLVLVWQRIMMPTEADRCAAHLGGLPEGSLLARQTQVRLHRLRGQHAEAEELLASLVADSPAAQRTGLVREWVNLKLARQDFEGAKSLLLKEHELRPTDLATLLVLAELDAQSGRWDDVQKWEQKLAKHPHPAELHTRILSVRRLLARAKSPSDAAFAQAESELRILREQASTWAEVAALAGTVAQLRGDKLEEAASYYAQAVALGERRLAVFQNLIAILERLGRLTEAQEYLQRLESQIPLDQTLTMLQGAVEMRLDQPERALAVARQAVDKRPQDVAARLWLARVLVLHEQLDEAEAELKQAMKLAPRDLRVASALALFYVGAKKSAAAVSVAEQIQKQQDLPEAERYFVAAQAFELAGKRDLAEESFRLATAADPKNAQVQFRMAEFYLRSDSQKAEACLEQTLKLDPQHLGARRTLALVLASRGTDEDWARAQSLLSGQAQDQSAAAGDDRLHAILLVRRSGTEGLHRAQTLLEQLVAKAQSVPLDRLLLAQVYERQALLLVDEEARAGKLAKARSELEFLANRPQVDWTHFTAILEFFHRHRSQPEINKWLSRFQQWLERQPKPPPEAIAQLVRLQLKHEASAQSGPWLDQLEAMKVDPLPILLLRAQWCSQQKQTDQIRQIVDTQGEALLSQEQPDEGKSRILGGIARIYRAVKELEDAERWERRLLAHDPERYEGLAAVLTQQGRWSEAMDLCRQGAETDKTIRPAQIALACLTSTQITSEKVADCEPLIQAALQNNKNTADLHYSLGIVRIVQQRTPDAIAEFKEVVKANPRHVPAMNNLALLLAEDKDAARRKEALAMIDRAIDLAGLTPDLCDTKGTILLLDGQTDEAVRFLEMATQGQNVDPRFAFHLALAYDDQGNQEQARLYFERVMEGRLEEQILTDWDRRMLEQLRVSLDAEP